MKTILGMIRVTKNGGGLYCKGLLLTYRKDDGQWAIIEDCWLYGPGPLHKCLYQFFFERKADKHLVGY